MFLLVAVVIAGIQQLIISGHLQASARVPSGQISAVSERDLRAVLDEAIRRPSAKAYMRVSQCFEKRRDYKMAIYYLRKAEAYAALEEHNE